MPNKHDKMKSSAFALVVIAMMIVIPLLGNLLLAGTSVAAETCSRFPETGKTVCGRFLAYWNENGGLKQQGYPISDMFQEKNDTDGKTYTVQYFQRAVFEAHPENQPPEDVQLSLLGVWALKAHTQPATACTYCPAGFDPWKDDQAPTAADPLNPDGIGDITVEGPAFLDVEQTSNGKGGPAAPDGSGTHDFYILPVPAGTSMMIKSYDVSHVRVWRFNGMPSMSAALCHVWAEAYRYWSEHKNNKNVVVLFMGQPIK